MKILSRLSIKTLAKPESKATLYLYQDKDGHYYGTTRKIEQNGYKLLNACLFDLMGDSESEKFVKLVDKLCDDDKHWFFLSKPFINCLNNSVYSIYFDDSEYSIKIEKGKVYFRDDIGGWSDDRYISSKVSIYYYINNDGKLVRR